MRLCRSNNSSGCSMFLVMGFRRQRYMPLTYCCVTILLCYVLCVELDVVKHKLATAVYFSMYGFFYNSIVQCLTICLLRRRCVLSLTW